MAAVEEANTGFGSREPSGCQPGVIRLNAHVAAKFGGTYSGCFARTRLTSGRRGWHWYGKALDRGFNFYDPNQAAAGNRLFDWYVANREALGLQQTIGGHRIWDIEFGERRYHRDDHMNHVHGAFGYGASQHWTADGSPTPPSEVPDLDAQDKAMLRDLHAAIGQYQRPTHMYAVAASTTLEGLVQAAKLLIRAVYPNGDPTQPHRLATLVKATTGATGAVRQRLDQILERLPGP